MGNNYMRINDQRKTLLGIMVICGASAFAQIEHPDSITRDLDEVVVSGDKPQVIGRDGILVVDLPAIVKDKPVTNILEVLSYVPGVVSNENGLSLNGTTGVTIILNGELTNMPLQNLYQLLYSTPVDRLKSVEVMYSAPAKYHVSGAVLNVVLKTPRPIDGLMGQAQIGYDQAHYASYRGGVAATYAFKDWTFDFNWSLTKSKSWKRQETASNHMLNTQRVKIDDDMQQIGKRLTNLLYASVAYKTLKLTYNGQMNTDACDKSLSKGTFGDYINRYTYLSPPAYHNVALRYATPFGLTVGGDYIYYNEHREQRLAKEYTELLNALNKQSIKRYHIYADCQHQLGNVAVNYGLEYQHSDDHSSQSYRYPQMAGFDDVLREDVADGYVGLEASFDWGLSFNASAKAEYFHNDYQHNWNFVPQLGATYYKTPKSIFQLNFTSQRIYPQYWELHGGTSYVNEYSMIKGNPALQPYLNYASQLSYILSQKYVATFYYLFADKYSVQLPYQLPDELQLLFQTVNLDFSRTLGLQITVPFNVRNIWNVEATANVFHKQEKASHFHDISFDNRRWSFYGELNNTLKFTPGSPVSLAIDLVYLTGTIQGPGRFNSFGRVDAGAKWQFGNKRCCELALRCTDLFNTWTPTLTINHAGQDYRMTAYEMMRNFKVSFI
ncbi:MAG: outer membrane beta-barrel protein [Muribaculaceae bacterium]|nr:outer membrane beta-barrel protein [Muribaculaceae bacterium]